MVNIKISTKIMGTTSFAGSFWGVGDMLLLSLRINKLNKRKMATSIPNPPIMMKGMVSGAFWDASSQSICFCGNSGSKGKPNNESMLTKTLVLSSGNVW